MLEYQTIIYRKSQSPIIPILIYHGRQKEWKRSLSFQDSLKDFTSELRGVFSKNVLNFTCRFLNIRKLDVVGDESVKFLTSRPILFIMSYVWCLDQGVVERLFDLGVEKKY